MVVCISRTALLPASSTFPDSITTDSIHDWAQSPGSACKHRIQAKDVICQTVLVLLHTRTLFTDRKSISAPGKPFAFVCGRWQLVYALLLTLCMKGFLFIFPSVVRMASPPLRCGYTMGTVVPSTRCRTVSGISCSKARQSSTEGGHSKHVQSCLIALYSTDGP